MESYTPPPKTILESKLYDENKKKLGIEDQLLDEITFGITYLFATGGDKFPIVDELNNIRCGHTKTFDYNPSLTLYFKEYEDKIVLLDIEINEDDLPF